MTFFNTLYFVNDEISSFSFFSFEPAPVVSYTTLIIGKISLNIENTFLDTFQLHNGLFLYLDLMATEFGKTIIMEV